MKKLVLLLILSLCGCWQSLSAQDIFEPKELAKVKIISHMDDPYWQKWSYWIWNTLNGDVLVSGYGFKYIVYVASPSGTNKQVDIRIGMYQNRVLKGLSRTFTGWVRDGMINTFFPAFRVGVPAGDYDLRVLVKSPEEDTWKVLLLEDDGSATKYHRFTVYDKPRAPLSKYFAPDWIMPGDLHSNDNIVDLYVLSNEPFKLTTKLFNPLDEAMEGKIRVVYERNMVRYWRQENIFHESELQDLSEVISDPVDVHIAPHSYQDYILPCKFKRYINDGNRYSPFVYMYYQAKGSNTWELVTIDMSDYFEGKPWSTSYYGLNYLPVSLGAEYRSEEDLAHDIRITYQQSSQYPYGEIVVEGLDEDTYASLESWTVPAFCDKVDTTAPYYGNFKKGGDKLIFQVHKSIDNFLLLRGKINRNIKLKF